MEDLIKNDATFELYHNSEGANLLNNRVLLTYPSEKSSFQIDLGGDGYSNFEDKKDEKVEDKTTRPRTKLSDIDTEKFAEGITATVGAVTAIGSTVQALRGGKPSRRKALKEECGKRPVLKRNREGEYNKCVADYNAGIRGGVVDTKSNTNQNEVVDEDTNLNDEKRKSNQKKIIIGLVVVAVLVSGYIAYKKGFFSKKSVK